MSQYSDHLFHPSQTQPLQRAGSTYMTYNNTSTPSPTPRHMSAFFPDSSHIPTSISSTTLQQPLQPLFMDSYFLPHGVTEPTQQTQKHQTPLMKEELRYLRMKILQLEEKTKQKPATTTT
jgi:hypothetical protein